MNVLLINPPRMHEITGNNPSVIEASRGCNPPLGLLYIAAYMERNTAHTVQVADAQVEALDYPALEERIRLARPDVVGLTAMSLTLLDVMMTVAVVRRAAPEARVVLGGPHVHLYPEETIRLPGVDYLVLGEGEYTFSRLVDALSGPAAALHGIPGIVFREDGRVIMTGAPGVIDDLDALPFPARHLVPYRRYSSILAAGSCATTIFTSRGCPYQCAFCDRPHMGTRFRARSPGNVVDELAVCHQMGIRDFLFYDDTFAVRQDRAMAIGRLIRERGLDIRFDIRTRVDTVSDELLATLARAGCQAIHYGVESGSPRILETLNKRIDLGMAEEVFRMTRRHGMSTLAYFMIGNPGETQDDIEMTFEVIRRLAPDYLHLTILTPFPGTQVYRMALETGVIPHDVWREFARQPVAGFVPPHWDACFSREELERLLARGYRGFYLRPRYVLRRLARLHSWSGFLRHLGAGLRVLRMR